MDSAVHRRQGPTIKPKRRKFGKGEEIQHRKVALAQLYSCYGLALSGGARINLHLPDYYAYGNWIRNRCDGGKRFCSLCFFLSEQPFDLYRGPVHTYVFLDTQPSW